MRKSYAIIGTGAIGGYCAVKLQQAGFDVNCLLRNDYSLVKENGLTLIESNQSITVPVNAFDDIKKMPPCDVVVIALKTTANAILKNSLHRILKMDSVILVLQNGIGMEEEMAEFIDPEKIVGGTCYLKVTKTAPSVIRHFGFNTIELAQYYVDDHHEAISPAVEELSLTLKNAGFDAKAMPHLPTIRWKKLSGNIATSGLSVVLNASHNDLVENPSSFSLLKQITLEVIAAAKKSGAHLPEDFYEFREKVFESFKAMERHNSSMKDDFDAKKPLELHAIYENAIKIAKNNGATMPLTEMLYQQLLYLDARVPS